MSYGLGISNVTNLDKDKKATLSQEGAFTVVSPQKPVSMTALSGANENLLITGFHFIGISKQWQYRLLKWLAKKFAG